MELHCRGPLDWWLKGSPTYKHQETNRLSKWASESVSESASESKSAPSTLRPCVLYLPAVEFNSESSALSQCGVHTCRGARLSFFYTESLCRVYVYCVWSSGSANLCWACGEKAQQILAEFVGVRLGIVPFQSQPAVVESGPVYLSWVKCLLLWSSANSCWVRDCIDFLRICWLTKRAVVF